MSTLYLIRHGRTAANDAHLYCGSTDLPLSPQGIRELKTLTYDLHPRRILTSGMLRTEQTLQLILGEVPHEINREFREIDFGDFEMKSYEQLKDDPDYQQWISGDNEANVPPHGESGLQMTTRVLNALKEVLDREEDTLIVTHGGVIAAIMAAFFPEAGLSRYQWQPRPGRGYAIGEDGCHPIP